jgi:LmbE family N-acetylglucosaminyl deacetylase
MSTKRLLGTFAHPDDEGGMGGAFLKYKMEGVETGLIVATRGEVGEISDPALATPENLGPRRRDASGCRSTAIRSPLVSRLS